MTAAGGPSHEGLAQRFPALRQLARARRGHVPHIAAPPLESAPACLAMVLAFHGRRGSLEEVRGLLDPGRFGRGAVGIANAADHFGLRARSIRVDVDDLELVERGSILSWRLGQYVVLDRLRKGGGCDIVDPAHGRVRLSRAEFADGFSGVAICFAPGDDFRGPARRASGVWAFARRVLLGDEKAHLAQVAVTSVFLQLVALSVPLLTSLVVDRVAPRGDYHLLAVVAVGLLGVAVFQLASSYLRSYLLLALRTRLDERMTLALLDHLIALPYPFFQSRSAGDLVMRLGANAQVRDILTAGALSAPIDAFLVVFYLVILFLVNALMAAVAVAFAALYVAVFFASRRRKRVLASRLIGKEVRSSSYEIEMLSAMDTLKSLGAERRAAEAWSHMFVEVLDASLARGRFDTAIDAALAALRFASPLAMLAVGGLLVLDGELTLGAMFGLTAVAAGFLTPLDGLVATAIGFQTVQSYVEKIDEVLEVAPEQEGEQLRPARQLSGAVTLHRVSFRYGESSPLVVKDVTIDIPPGALVAVVGKTGSGKSTLMSLMSGLYTPTTGRVLYDGHSLADYDVRSVRRQLGVVTQNPSLFATTVRANVSLANPGASFQDLVWAARTACVHDDIVAMPLGYDTPLLDRGASLSGGQRQRIALARALLARPAVLLLDEATSALDGITERNVQRELERLRCTRVVIAHRLSTVRDADLILVMDRGEVIEQGTHLELMSRGGFYANLVFPDEQAAL